ncbi:MAG TPA: AMIN domain-containing protein, partial [Vicinamibacterales bacterium]|nr:AMIN domain-containing protein [Vicinamibacterales bacterium]
MRLAGLSARLLPAVFVAGLGSLVLAAGDSSARLVSVSAVTPAAGAAGDAVLIEASEPVAYSVSRPDPQTVLVEMRNVRVEGAASRLDDAELVRGVEFEDAIALDGNAVGRVRLALTRPATHKVRSDRGIIRVDLEAAPHGERADSDPVASGTSGVAPAAAGRATVLQTVRATTANGVTTVLLHGNGALSAGEVREAEDMPPRLVVDFPGLTFTAPAQTRVSGGPVRRVRVGMNQRTPPITRVVIDLEQRTPFQVEQRGDGLAVVVGATPGTAAPSGPSASTGEDEALLPRDAETGEILPILSDLTATAGTGAIDPTAALKLAAANVPAAPAPAPKPAPAPTPAPAAPAP